MDDRYQPAEPDLAGASTARIAERRAFAFTRLRPHTLVSHTPFDAVYVPTASQPHVEVTAENAAWFRAELEQCEVGGGARVMPALSLRAGPNPFGGTLRIDFAVAGAGPAALEVFGIDGRRVRALQSAAVTSGTRAVSWDGRDDGGRTAPPGVYFVRLSADGVAVTRRVVRFW
ncbi:MAG: T9SS type A sorting domain-containing protein [Candidatus Eisenbacteria bacterium]|uniref:T9SS type A sorting domain-containing protein n=1 Tax=Eiseniibacteriota bacterium TaxID=2212470 RepID=A0A849SJK2_UNCEI|nr:T9SS type A sorting domain-containing protein [Candidatus Eisenbacteria bacterium]